MPPHALDETADENLAQKLRLLCAEKTGRQNARMKNEDVKTKTAKESPPQDPTQQKMNVKVETMHLIAKQEDHDLLRDVESSKWLVHCLIFGVFVYTNTLI